MGSICLSAIAWADLQVLMKLHSKYIAGRYVYRSGPCIMRRTGSGVGASEQSPERSRVPDIFCSAIL